MLAADHCRAGEVVALEQVEAQVVAEFHLLDAFHFLSEQRLAQRLEIGNELLQSRRFDAADVDLDDLRKFQELAILVQRLRPLAHREDVAGEAQLFAARDHFRCLRHRLKDLEHDRVWRQRVDQIAEEQTLIDLDEPLVWPERVGHRKLGEGVRDDHRRCLVAIDKAGEVAILGLAAAEQKFVGEELLFAVENRLAAEENLLQNGVGHGIHLLACGEPINLSIRSTPSLPSGKRQSTEMAGPSPIRKQRIPRALPFSDIHKMPWPRNI